MSQKGYGDILAFVYIGTDEILKYMQYEVSMTVYMCKEKYDNIKGKYGNSGILINHS